MSQGKNKKLSKLRTLTIITSGSLEHMALDRIMPAFFSKNQRGPSCQIITLFFFLLVSILLPTHGRCARGSEQASWLAFV
jgi:hypothetical protein